MKTKKTKRKNTRIYRARRTPMVLEGQSINHDVIHVIKISLIVFSNHIDTSKQDLDSPCVVEMTRME
jgi:hypothetical protein